MDVKISPNFSIGKYHWNHRVVRKNGMLAIHEVHYATPGASSGPCGTTVDPVDVHGETIEELRWTLEHMLRCLDKPIIDFATQKDETVQCQRLPGQRIGTSFVKRV
jgi:hypothetical protein